MQSPYFAALLWFAPCAPSHADEAPPVVRSGAPNAHETALSALLRRSRDADAPKPTELIAQAAALGAGAVEPALGILLTHSIPPTQEGQAVQQLNEPQRELLLGALQQLPPEPALARIELELKAGPGFERAWAALHVWSAVGTPEDLVRGLEFAAASMDGSARDRLLERAAEQAAQRSLLRRPEGHEALRRNFQRIDPRLRLELILAVGATRDGRAAGLLADVLDSDPELAPAALAQAQVIRRSNDARVHAALRSELREQLRAESVPTRTVALRALGVQRDWQSVERMLELLDDPDERVRESALWALERATDLHWRGPDAWRAWNAAEMRWGDERLERVIEQLQSSAPGQLLPALEEVARHPLFAESTSSWAVDALGAAAAEVRRAAAEALGKLGDPQACAGLVEALEDAEPEVARAAHVALSRICGLDLPAEAQLWRAALAL